ncbi:MAG: DUF3179 domain-containing protein [Flavobacteriales bacterium]|nr:DUF3179 domain-containing protein [Flavobacteriales bacterium]
MRIFLFLPLFALFSCGSDPQEVIEQVTPIVAKHKRPISIKNGKFFEVNGQQLLYGGEDSTQHFNITGYILIDKQFHYGIGREVFPALLKPEFISVTEADTSWADTTRFLVAYSGNEVKAYSIKDLTKHEVVNDVLDGKPIMAAYCVLADLGAIYERTYGDKVLTFALSGYTYHDDNVWDGLDGFVLWDRETESLWWPLIDKAVSGPLKGVHFLEMDKAHWEDTTWDKIKKSYPNAMIMKSGLDFERPTSWEKLDDVSNIVERFSVKQ